LGSKTGDPRSWELQMRRQSEPEGDQYSAYRVTWQVYDTLGFFYVARNHMRCDVGWGREEGCVLE